VETKDGYVRCGYSDIWSVCLSGTVVVCCGGDP
jgi:hypothetical protein